MRDLPVPSDFGNTHSFYVFYIKYIIIIYCYVSYYNIKEISIKFHITISEFINNKIKSSTNFQQISPISI